MRELETPLDGLRLFEQTRHFDRRGAFMESWTAEGHRVFGLGREPVQDNVSWSGEGVLRGLHMQWPHPQAKLVSVVSGAIYDVAVDARPDSPSFGSWHAVELSADNGRQLFVPEGFLHGFCVLGPEAIVTYKVSERYRADCQRGVRYDDPELGIRWPYESPVVSPRDASWGPLSELRAIPRRTAP